MADVLSLGLHEPAALQYLHDEGLLADQSIEPIYTWQVHPIYGENGEVIEDEILQTKECVVWARGGVVKRAFNLAVEEEKIQQSLITSFPGWEEKGLRRDVIASANAADHESSVLGSERSSIPTKSNDQAATHALVVILQTKAHVYFLKGDSHVVSLPFEVERAFPAPQGCFLQRKSSVQTNIPASLSVPQNSFVSSQLTSSLTKSQYVTIEKASASRPSLTLSTAARSLVVPPSSRNAQIPSVFSLTDPQADLGVAVEQLSVHQRARGGSQEREQPFDPAETLLYVSQDNEIASSRLSNVEPLLLAVTWNSKSGASTVWKVQYKDRDNNHSLKKKRKVDQEGLGSRRRSSNRHRVNGSSTPVGRGLRESRGSLGPQLASSFAETHLSQGREEQKSSEVDNLATELGSDFADVGVQTRAARRVSSLLARTDLSMGPDRGPINGFAGPNTGRKSLNRAGPRGESIGEIRDRHSFGAGIGSSLLGIDSFTTKDTSFAAIPPDRLPEGLSFGGEFEGFENKVPDETISDLATEVVFSRVHTFPSSNSTSTTKSSNPRFTIFTLPPAQLAKNGRAAKTSLCVCIMDSQKGELSVVRLEVMIKTSVTTQQSKTVSRNSTQEGSLRLTAINVQRGTNIVDACQIRDGEHCCMLMLTQNADGQMTLLLEALGIFSIKIDLPNPLMVHHPFADLSVNDLNRRREGGRLRVIKGPLHRITCLENTSIRGQVDLVDPQTNRHRLQIQLEPRDSEVKKLLNTVEFVLQDKGGANVYMVWIEIMRWLRTKGETEMMEWPAMVITLFSMIVPFVPDKRERGRAGGRNKKAALPRSSSGSAVDMSQWDEMVDKECGIDLTSPAWSTSSGWEWTMIEADHSKTSAQHHALSKSRGSTTLQTPFHSRKNGFIVQCVSWTREFMQTPASDQMRGSEGVFPFTTNKNPEARRTAIGSVLVSLHLLREEQKLDIRRSQSNQNKAQLAPVLAQMGHWLNWQSWGTREGCYYHVELTHSELQLLDENKLSSSDTVSQPFAPPSIFEYVEAASSDAHKKPFLTLLDVVGNRDPTVTESSMSTTKRLTPRTFAVVKYFSRHASLRGPTAKVEWISKCEVDAEMLTTLPVGIAATFYDAIASCEGSSSSSWSEPILKLIGREDLALRVSLSSSPATTSKIPCIIGHEALRDYHGIGNSMLETEPSHSWDAASEADRQVVTRLIFRDDRRFQDASRLVNQLRTPVAECHPEPDWTEADLLDAQKELVQLVTMRTLTVASGRGMMNYSSRVPLLTEKVPVSAFTLQCQVRPSNVTFTADRASFTEDRAVWAFFHNGTAAGMTISKDAKGIDTSWILYNKPQELTNRHAGFLLALGLNGHLKSLAKWVAFKYLTPKHTMTSIGLLLGLSASYLGTMDTLITRLLSVHVTRMLPPGAAELNLSPLTQTTGIMGIGLLYCYSQHRRMSEVMLSEIENNDVEEGVPPEQTLRDEGYRLAAGFALGFINLGQGKRLHGLRDMNVLERLLTIAIGTKNVNLVHVLDRATSGATVAFALIYMKTNDESIARKIDIPDTLHQFDYVRPDIFLLRTVARHLIMWSSIQPTYDFIRSSLPKPYRHRVSLFSTRNLNSEDMPFFNILAGLCLALGLRFAGSSSHIVRDLLTSYLDQFIRLNRLPALNYDAKLTRNAVRNCQDVTALALAAVMAGSGDLIVFRRLRSLHGRADLDTPYGSHLAAHMAIGILFLGGGTYTLDTSDIAVASLLCAFYPLFPTTVMDNQAHLQAFRHLWVLATVPRCIICRDVDTGRPVSMPIVVITKDREGVEGRDVIERHLTAPCLLPDLKTITEIRTQASGYWDVTLTFPEGADGKAKRAEFSKHHLNLHLRRRAAYDAPGGSVFATELQALAEQGVAPSVGLSASAAIPLGSGVPGSGVGANPFEWLWELDAFQDLDVSERALVLPHASNSSIGAGVGATGAGNRYLKGTVVDTRLELEHAIISDKHGSTAAYAQRDQLWQLRLLFAWVDRLDREEEEEEEEEKEGQGRQTSAAAANWLRRDVVERLRWRVWKMGAGIEDDEEDAHG